MKRRTIRQISFAVAIFIHVFRPSIGTPQWSFPPGHKSQLGAHGLWLRPYYGTWTATIQYQVFPNPQNNSFGVAIYDYHKGYWYKELRINLNKGQQPITTFSFNYKQQ